MSRQSLVIVGGGGHARVVADIARLAEFDVAGFTSTDANASIPGLDCLGNDSVLPQLRERGVSAAFVAIGDNRLCARLQRELTPLFSFPTLVHPRAILAQSTRVGSGSVVMAGAVLNPLCEIGDGAIVNTAASIDHDCSIGAFAHVAPGCHLAGNVFVGEGSFLGIGTVVIPGVRIGTWSTVGAGAAVTSDLPDGCLALGVPAQVRERSNA